eukprot:EST44153.1 Hypothetical protein SS50377_16057 [Spironucleus salmonicida]
MMKRKLHMWSHEDEEKLKAAILEQGLNWKYICKEVFPNVSPSGVKNMYYLLLKTDEGFKEQIQTYSYLKRKSKFNLLQKQVMQEEASESSQEFLMYHYLEF